MSGVFPHAEFDGDLENPALDLLLDPDEVGVPSTDAIRWLLNNGAGIEAIGARWTVGAARVCFQPNGRYVPVPGLGSFAYVFACLASDGVADLAAWQPSSGRIMTRLGNAGLIGQIEAEKAASDITARPVNVWRSPLGWLRANRAGVVIVNPRLAAHLLGGLNVIPEDDNEHGRELRALRVPPPRVLPAMQRKIAA
jgi:hypothetical protein